ncbi:MAG TPA: glutaminase, partial [Tissierellaceae bacterium]
MEDILKGAYAYAKPFTKEGKLVDYIPALAKADKEKLAASIIDENGNVYEIGDVDIKFSMMSIVKVILYLIALENYEFDEITNLIGLKGSSKPYNSLLDLEMSNEKKPVNPFINAG